MMKNFPLSVTVYRMLFDVFCWKWIVLSAVRSLQEVVQ